MWTFRPGYLGVSIAVIALLGGVLLGSLLNVSSHDVQTTKYDYVSDISGLFDVSDEPQYIDYNPATNYTGYTNVTADPENPSGIKYTSAGLANNYRIATNIPQSTAGPGGTVNNSTSLPQTDLSGLVPHSSRLASAEYVHSNAFTSDVRYFKVASVYDWATAVFGDLNDYSAISVSVDVGAYTSPTTRAGFCATVSSTQDNVRVFLFNTSPGVNNYTINPQDKTITRYVGASNTPYTYSMYDVFVCYGDADQVESYISTSGGSAHWEYTSDSTTLTFSYTSNVTRAPSYDYLLPSSGVYNNSTQTTWDNDTATTQYDNQRIQVVFGPKFDNGSWSLPSSFGAITLSVDNTSIDAFHPLIGYNSADKWYFEPTGASSGRITLGDFRALTVELEKTASGLNWAVYGVTSFISYTDLSISPIASASGSFSGSVDLDKLFFHRTGSGLAWSVYNTVVFMDTYGAVLADPSIDLADYWPDMDSYRFAFQSFALYGDSITMNGVTYPVSNESIVINDHAYKLDNFYLSFSEQGDTSITFNNVNRTIDLGPTVDKVVSFAGNWGFTTGLYEGSIDVKKAYDWNIKLLGDNLNTIILIALGLVAVLMLACKWLGMSFKMTDKVVLGGSALFLVLLLVV